MAACDRKCMWNNIYLSLYTLWQHNFNGFTYVINVKQHKTDLNIAVCRGEWDIKDGGLEVGAGSWHEMTYISACIQMIATQFQRLYLCFRCQATRLDWSKNCRFSGCVRNQRWRPGTGSANEITCSATMRDGNKILTAIPNVFKLKQHDCTRCEYCPMSGWMVYQKAAYNSEWIYTTTHPDIEEYSD